MATATEPSGLSADQNADLNPNQLLERVRDLEKQLKLANEQLRKAQQPEPSSTLPTFQLRPGSPKSPPRAYDPSKYSSRKIALKFAYLGQGYNGFEYTKNNTTPLPTVEETLWKALVRARLLWPANNNTTDVDFDGFDYTKCGRTDKGVSAFGQVVGVRVRSNKPLPRRPVSPMELDVDAKEEEKNEQALSKGVVDDVVLDMPMEDLVDDQTHETEFDDLRDEIHYLQILNNILPPEIRILAWSPVPESFSARFSCSERRYRYFFTNPAFNPTPGKIGTDLGLTVDSQGQTRRDGWLDIEAMKKAAKKYEGLHDFRNLCKLDPTKQLTHFQRRIFVSEIREVDPASEPAAYVAGKGFSETAFPMTTPGSGNATTSYSPKVYQFILNGSAFLWHQVRHMVAILFLIGQGLEPVTLIDELFDVEKNPRKPQYEMADDGPLVLWDCIFSDRDLPGPHTDTLPWIWIGDTAGSRKDGQDRDKYGMSNAVDTIWSLWRKHKMDEILAGSLLNLAVAAGNPALQSVEAALPARKNAQSQWVFQGGDRARSVGRYVPVMQKRKMDAVEVQNARYLARKANSGKKPGQDPVEERGEKE